MKWHNFNSQTNCSQTEKVKWINNGKRLTQDKKFPTNQTEKSQLCPIVPMQSFLFYKIHLSQKPSCFRSINSLWIHGQKTSWTGPEWEWSFRSFAEQRFETTVPCVTVFIGIGEKQAPQGLLLGPTHPYLLSNERVSARRNTAFEKIRFHLIWEVI